MRTVRPWLVLALLASFPFVVAACGASAETSPDQPPPASGSENVGAAAGMTAATQSTPGTQTVVGPTGEDRDADGILDAQDSCPDDPEDRDGDRDADGCPESGGEDRDGDGILDAQDSCPDDPEDRDGFEDEDGCPDPDNDRDGVRDANDMCPNDPESPNGRQDEDGCPD